MVELTAIRRVGTGRIAFVGPDTMVYAPFKATVEDARAALQEIHRDGLYRPMSDGTGQLERVYPIEYCVTENPREFVVFLRNDHAELIEARLLVRHYGEHRTPGPWPNDHSEDLIDPFKL